MSNYFRWVANELVKGSIADGKLDLEKLYARTLEWANKEAQGGARDADYYAEQLTVATREVLGLVPKAQWRKATGWERVEEILDDAPVIDHGLQPSRVPQQYDPNKTLREQGFVFLTNGGRGKRELALEVQAYLLDQAMQAALDGGAVSSGEKAQLEAAAQKFLAQHKALEVPLSESDRKALTAELATLAKAGVTEKDAVVGNELRAIAALAKPLQKGAGR